MKKHHFLETVACNAVIFSKDKEILNPGFMGTQQVFLYLQTVFFAGGRLVDGFKPVLLEQLTGLDRIDNNPFYLHFRDCQPVHPTTH